MCKHVFNEHNPTCRLLKKTTTHGHISNVILKKVDILKTKQSKG